MKGKKYMNVLLINNFWLGGGSEVQSKRELKMWKDNNHKVLYLTFDHDFDESFEEEHINLKINKSIFAKGFNYFFINPFIKKKIKKILNEFKPDLIRVNNISICFLSVYSAVKKYKIIQTIRDYAYVCPFATCIHNDYSICKGFKFDKCRKKCINNLSGKLKLIKLKKLYKVSRKYVSKFLCPSEALTKTAVLNGYNCDCVNNPFDFSLIQKEFVLKNEKDFLYYGKIDSKKGVFNLISAFEIFHKKHKDSKLLFMGHFNEKDRVDFENKLCDYILYLGYFDNLKTLEVVSKTYCVVVPSLWIENYPNTVLESFGKRTIVIGSNRGGIVEMVNDQQLLFDVLNIEDIVNKMEYAYNLTENEYASIVERNMEYILNKNSINSYYEKLINNYKEIGD